MSDDVIMNYIRNSGKTLQIGRGRNHLSEQPGSVSGRNKRAASNRIIWRQPRQSNPVPGRFFSDNTAATAFEPTSAPYVANNVPSVPNSGSPPALQEEAPAAPAPEINFNYFHDQLAPFGTWVDVGGVTYWRPDQRSPPIPTGVPIMIWDSGSKLTMVCIGSQIIPGVTSLFTMAVGF